MSDYPKCVRELLESEILGEALFIALFQVAKNPTDKYHFGTLLQLETETKARLRPLLYKYDIPLDEEVNSELVEQLVALYLDTNWIKYMNALRPVATQFIERFKQIVEVGPTEDKTILKSMVVHEFSILKWIDLEIAGNKEESLKAVIDQLQYPIAIT